LSDTRDAMLERSIRSTSVRAKNISHDWFHRDHIHRNLARVLEVADTLGRRAEPFRVEEPPA
jgi:hypothetical protein